MSLKKAEEADLKIIILDQKTQKNSHFLRDLADGKSLLVINKIDLENYKFDTEIKKFNPVLISLKKETNINGLIDKIKTNLENKFKGSENILITRERHRINLEECLENLKSLITKVIQVTLIKQRRI